ncbi:CoA-transferase [Clostridium felsineum]|uniref:CoA-transferase n=1 Tax=Clostridium felsineum TaxID=36839 RepID=UPI00098BF3B7|nr:CoA-transferase [Clostridium felsineum]URZ03582.1 hypothetical protein CLAUR_036430 [Clostridium felsineum]
MENIIYSDLDDMIVKNINKGMYIHIAATMSRPNAAVNSLVRCFKKDSPEFTISATGLVGNLHAIAMSGIAKHVITGFFGDNCPKPRPNWVYKNIISKGEPFTVEQTSMLTLIERLMGGALNLPYVTTNSLTDSDLLNEARDYAFKINDPCDSKKSITLLKSLSPDITLVHGICADEKGNVVLSGPLGEGNWGCLAAKKGVLVTVEKIVSSEVIKKNIDKVVIPGDRVIGVCEVPFGAYPQGMRIDGVVDIENYYDDYDYFDEARNATKTSENTEKWFDKWINIGQAEYLEMIRREKKSIICKPTLPKIDIEPTGKPSVGEILIILASRAIIEKVKKYKYRTILAGIGFAHIAAWIASSVLEKQGIHVRIMSELGFYGMVPYYGDVFLFSQRHAANCEKWSNVLEILGAQVGYQRKCLGVLGAAEVDEEGNINSTLLKDGSFMTGSGGANDIASVTDSMVIVAAGKKRMVNKVEFITSPGTNVKDVVTTFGRFGRNNKNEKFKLETWYSEESLYKDPKDNINNLTNWAVDVDKDLIEEANISFEERKLVWTIDPEGVYR